MNNIKAIYFDMDGTIADLYGVQGWLDMIHQEDTTPFEVAQPLVNMELLNRMCKFLQLQGYTIGVITWTSKRATKEYKSKIRQAKKEWLKKYFPVATEIHIIQYGYSKRKVAKVKQSLLFDDEVGNVETWRGDKGDREAIRVTSELSILKALVTLIEG